MKNTVVETKQGFLATRRNSPVENYFSPHLSEAVRLDPITATRFADRYDGAMHTVRCYDCGAAVGAPCEPGCGEEQGHSSVCECADCSGATLSARND